MTELCIYNNLPDMLSILLTANLSKPYYIREISHKANSNVLYNITIISLNLHKKCSFQSLAQNMFEYIPQNKYIWSHIIVTRHWKTSSKLLHLSLQGRQLLPSFCILLQLYLEVFQRFAGAARLNFNRELDAWK